MKYEYWFALLATLSAIPMGIAEGLIIKSKGIGVLKYIPMYLFGVVIYLIGFKVAYRYISFIVITWEVLAIGLAFITVVYETGGMSLLLQPKILIGIVLMVIGSFLLAYGSEFIFKTIE